MRILVVRIGRAGDIVMTTPALNAIFDLYPDAEVTVLTGPDGRRLLKDFNSRLEDIWVWNRSGIHDFFDKRKIKKRLESHPFDIIFCLDTSKSIASLFRGTKAKLYWHDSLDNTKHCAKNYLDIVTKTGDKSNQLYYSYLPVSGDAEKRVEDELLSHDISPDDIVVMLHPSYSGYTTNLVKAYLNRNNRSFIHRFWPSQNFSRLADLISSLSVKNGKTPKVIIDLVPEEAPLGQAVVNNSDSPVTLLQVKPDFERYKALIKRSDLIITPNTGPMHIAAAVGTKIVALFSNWDPVDCGPYMDTSLFKVIRAEEMPEAEHGLAAITPEEVFNCCIPLLE